MKTKKRTFTINRSGYFITDKFHPFQCTVEGHSAYKYELALTGSPKWDQYGFLVDHHELDAKIKDYIRNNVMKSCEIVLEDLCDCIITECVDREVEIKKVVMRLSPARREDLGIVNGELRLVNPSFIDLPAFGVYECEF